MDITEQQILNALNMPEPTGDNAAAAGDNPSVSENADSSIYTREPETEDTGENGGDAGKEPMSADERRENAARRRKQEQQAAVDAAVKLALDEERARQKERDANFFRRAKLKNTVDGTDIETMEQFDAWEEQYRDAKLRQNLRAGKLTKEDLDAVVDSHPAVVAAKKAQEREQAAQRERQNAEVQSRIDDEIKQIGAIDPSIHSVEDLTKAPYAQELYGYVQRGFTFLEAFTQVNSKKISDAAAAAAKNSALSNARSKGHLNSPTNSRGAGAVSVPNDELAMFRLLNPKASADDIQNYYNKYNKKG